MSAKLGYIFIAPALALVVLFFLAPVLMTGVFSMTNMSTATGLTGGPYQITPSELIQLGDQVFHRKLLKRIGSESYSIS